MRCHLRNIGLGFLLLTAGVVASSADDKFASAVSHDDFLLPVESQQDSTRYGTFTTSSGSDLSDPFAVISSDSLWQNKSSVTWSRAVMDHLALNCTTSSVSEDGSPDQLGSEVRAESVYQPIDALKITGNVHNTNTDSVPTPVATNGAGASVETKLPLDTTFTAAINSDEAYSPNAAGPTTTTNAYDAQVQKPLGKLPVSLVLKGHLTETANPGAGATRLPSFEQSLVWKPVEATTIQAGLRQQQYQNVPGIDSQLNEALFADWSQKLLDDKLTWHSYAEMTNTRGTVQVAAAGAGANGTPQPTVPQGGTTLASATPVSANDEKVTFSTGPSLQLQKDVSASLQYSRSLDQNPVPGTVGDEQRVSVSLKGTF